MRYQLSLRQILFTAMLTVSLIPVLILAAWVHETALSRELDSVKEKHLLLARNLTTALQRYSSDLSAAFNHSIQDVQRNDFNLTTQQLLSELQVTGFAYKTDNRWTTLFGDTQQHLSAQRLASLTDALSQAEQNVDQIIFSKMYSNAPASSNLYMLKKTAAGTVWIASVDSQYFVEIQQAISFGQKGHAAIVDQYGNLIAHPKRQWQLEAKNISKVKPVGLMTEGKTGVTQFFSPAVKAEMIAGYSTVQQTGWGVMIPQPLDELLQRANTVKQFALLLALAGIVGVALISWLIAGVIARPVEQVTRRTADLAAGKKNVSIAQHCWIIPSELHSLSASFNDMSAQIAQNQQQLEAKVEERTAKLRAAQQQSAYLAKHDTVTGLANRYAVQQQLGQLLTAERTFALLFIDLDGFKPVNDAHGHKVGDQVLAAVAERIQENTREHDIVARYGGDEFLVLLTHTDQQQAALDSAEGIRQSLCEPFHLSDKEIAISASIGVTMANNKIHNADMLIHQADEAMYLVKKTSKNGVRLVQQEHVSPEHAQTLEASS